MLHDFNLAAMYADRIAVLSAGRLAEIGTPREVLKPAMFAEVFGVEVTVLEHPKADCPLIVEMAGGPAPQMRAAVAAIAVN